MVSSSVRVRPIRSATLPNRTPPIAQPTSSTEVKIPVLCSVAAFAYADPSGSSKSVGTQFGAT